MDRTMVCGICKQEMTAIGVSVWKCTGCNYLYNSFNTKKILSKEILSDNNYYDIVNNCCPRCGKGDKNRQNLIKKIFDSNEENVYTCDSCGRFFIYKKTVR